MFIMGCPGGKINIAAVSVKRDILINTFDTYTNLNVCLCLATICTKNIYGLICRTKQNSYL